ncbi:MAG: putative alpha-glycosidase [Bacteroidetes bacterium]|nr:putative alpha-glycosidase [Bacteroidota bacterium]
MNKVKILVYISLVIMTINSPVVARNIKIPVALVSPNKNLELSFNFSPKGEISYAFTVHGNQLIGKSNLGLTGIDGPVLIKTSRRSVRTVWNPVWGKRVSVADVFNELTLDLKSYKIVARAYNDGVAFRYEYPSGKADQELTEFNFTNNYTAWFYNGENANIGPEKLSDSDGKRLPVMTVKVDDRKYLAIHEADLTSGDPLALESKKGETLFKVASKPGTAWRVIMYGKTPGDLVDSHILELLNPLPPKSMDFSWVKPGVAVWDWRINGAVVDDFKYEMSLPSWKRMVEFASENNIKYLVLDADWYGPEFGKDSDPVKGGKVS